jgi:hypothetical protein
VALGSVRKAVSGRRFTARSMIILSLFASASLTANGAWADPVPSSDSTPHPTATMQVGSSPAHVITCALFANKPNYSGNKITGTGGLSGCVPGPPDACSSEADLEVYLSGPGWVTAAASARQHSCPPPARSTTASLICDSSPATYSYRTLTLASIVHEGTDSNTSTSTVLNVKCL